MVGKTKPQAKKAAAKTVKKPTKSVKVVQKEEPERITRKILRMAICIAIPVLVGGFSAFLTGDAMLKFGELNKPPLAPPAWLFPVAWTILYVLMGIALYFIISKKPKTKQEKFDRKVAVVLFFAQLAFNFAWAPIFFLSGDYFFALMWLVIMWIMIVVLMFWARKRSMAAVWLLLPYALWCLFAMYLNFSIMMLN